MYWLESGMVTPTAKPIDVPTESRTHAPSQLRPRSSAPDGRTGGGSTTASGSAFSCRFLGWSCRFSGRSCRFLGRLAFSATHPWSRFLCGPGRALRVPSACQRETHGVPVGRKAQPGCAIDRQPAADGARPGPGRAGVCTPSRSGIAVALLAPNEPSRQEGRQRAHGAVAARAREGR